MTEVIGRAKIIVQGEVDPASMTTVGSKAGTLLTGALKTTAVAAGAGIGALVGTTLYKGFQRLNAIDQAEAKLRGLGNSARDVSKIMDNALNAVKGTAFGLGDAATVAAQLVAAQAKPGKELESQLKSVANLAAAAGISLGDMGSIYAKAMTQANGVQNDVLGQLQDRGIPIYQELGDLLGVTAGKVFDLAKDGDISFDQFAKAAKKAAGTVADEMGKTFQGSLDNTGAALGRVGAALLGPGFKDAPGVLQAINTKLDDMLPAAQKAGQAIHDFLANFKPAEPIGEGTVLAPDAKPDDSFAALLQQETADTAKEAGKSSWQKFLAGWLETMKDEAVTVGGQLMAAIGFGIAHADILSDLEKQGEKFGAWFEKKFDGIVKNIKDFGKEIKDAWREDVANLQDKWNGFTGWLSGTLSKIGDKFRSMWDGIKSAGTSAFNTLKSALNSVINGMNNAIDVFNAIPKVPDISHIPTLRAAGGPASGLTIIGERGPELLNLPNGSYVRNNNETQAMLSGTGGDVTINITTTGPVGTSLLQELNWWGKFGPLGVANG